VFREAITELWRINNELEYSSMPTGLVREAAAVNREKPCRLEIIPSLRITTFDAISIAPGGTNENELGLRKSPLKSEMFTFCIDSSFYKESFCFG
jgi:hypothetical protein